MNLNRFWLTFILMVIAQMVICNYFPASPYVMISILPAIVLLIPIQYGTPMALVVAFVTGLCVDFLSDGVPGLNAFSLVPVAFCRKNIVSLIFGEELFARKENVSFAKHGAVKVALALLFAEFIFFLLYIHMDIAGTRPFSFRLLRFVLSLSVSSPLALLVADRLTKEDRKRWN